MKFIHGDKISNFIGFGLMLGLENQTETPWSGSSCGNKLNTWIIIVRNKLYESSRRKPGWRFTAGFESQGRKPIFNAIEDTNSKPAVNRQPGSRRGGLVEQDFYLYPPP